MKRVCLIHYRLTQKGGLERRLINYINYFSENGYQVTVFATKKASDIKLPPNVIFQKVNIGLVPKQLRQLSFAKKIKQVISKDSFDICLSLGRTFHQTLILDGGNHIGYMQCLGYRIKYLKDYINIHLDREGFRQSKTIFACSGFVKDFNVQGFQTAAEKIKVVYPPINIKQFNQSLRSERATYRKAFEIKEGVTTFLFISTGHKMKNLSFLVELFKALDQDRFELVIAGSNPKRKLSKNIRYLGYVKKPEELYTAVDYTIHPALYEPFGQVIVESIQCGTPVIVSKNVGAKEVVTEKEGIIVDSFLLEDWLRVVQDLKNKTFEINKNFAVDNGLTLEQHMENILRHN